jgi:hypothetical protein
VNDRRNLTVGIVLLLLGVFFLLSRTFHFTGPGVILVLLGTIFLALSAARGFRGPLLPGGVLLGLGAGFLFQRTLDPILPGWATLLAGLGSGFLLVAALDRAAGRERRPAPLAPGLVLVGVAFLAALFGLTPLRDVLEEVRDLWPWALVLAGLALVGSALLRRRA